ncbi:hypothetical protein H0H93_006982 [Arthromyces matolae]|nr:hypothetical protein H0H93_006982 [Arthromyces matolae]
MTTISEFIHYAESPFQVLTSISAVLNAARTATQSEIAERFRSLSLTLHPDKQLDESHRAVATEEFQKLSKAYEGGPEPHAPGDVDFLKKAGVSRFDNSLGQSDINFLHD